jgi:hypothetical protein
MGRKSALDLSARLRYGRAAAFVGGEMVMAVAKKSTAKTTTKRPRRPIKKSTKKATARKKR